MNNSREPLSIHIFTCTLATGQLKTAPRLTAAVGLGTDWNTIGRYDTRYVPANLAMLHRVLSVTLLLPGTAK